MEFAVAMMANTRATVGGMSAGVFGDMPRCCCCCALPFPDVVLERQCTFDATTRLA